MRATVRHEMTEGVTAYEEKPREQWLFDYPAQVALTCTQIWWTTEVGIAFARLEEGYENAMKEYYKKQVIQLNTLITMLIGQLSKGDRQKIMTICTIDVHARDVVAKMIAQKVDSAQAFIWLSQLRHRWADEEKHCFANICDAQFLYSYEYLGNTPRLVITPLTDRWEHLVGGLIPSPAHFPGPSRMNREQQYPKSEGANNSMFIGVNFQQA
uniref:Dynein heavy chain hydrolytic ATP-binding dynein motor region domain-containing protein n=1 Tax=Terrapene triunguis TaxID=2587831 RepID=A0A674J8R4_9SAUR